MKFNTQLPDESVNVSKNSTLLDLLWMSLGVSLIILALYFLLGFFIEYSVKNISVEREQKLFSFLNDYKFEESNSSKKKWIKVGS